MIPAGPAAVPSTPAPPAAPAADAPASVRALIERQVAVLTRLTEIGMEIAEAAGRQAVAAAAPAEPEGPFRGDPGLAFTRVARAVRMTIALQSRLLHDLAALDRAEAADAVARRARRRSGVARLVELALEADEGAEHEDGGEARRLGFEAREWLRDADEEAELTGRPFAEVVGEICRDLGLSAEWTGRALALAAEEGGGGPAAAASRGLGPAPPGLADRASPPKPSPPKPSPPKPSPPKPSPAQPWPPPRPG